MQELVILVMTWAAVAVVLLVLIVAAVSQHVFDRAQRQWERDLLLKFTDKKKSRDD